ncbi:hypothetical protein BGW36DRAFT_396296 [Talaromyces proteolyticus]|uniref:25S rRNA (Uridine(2843)-N(3))-methyltransferase n=1 Tax=Talaromyces proteolyticus TaxID=1131652 RepID=A0AAD4KR22_9EURO|nr:uncharacterized protein BGW36DRAFT_396296 [Talaromyces proteolyticus]KAH8698539.1 hypothetical protein BGW36DRAFT_396296 [Talaromyces proteolyticus]
MGPKKNPPGKPSHSKGKNSESKKLPKTGPSTSRRAENSEDREINLSAAVSSIPLSLQQLLLNIFKPALLSPSSSPLLHAHDDQKTDPETKDDLHTQIQTLKAHLYNRDFVSAFADASPELLRAYALRWSASRCLAYVGVFKAVVETLLNGPKFKGKDDGGGTLQALCIGGGAGAEIIALAGVWRALLDEYQTLEIKEKEESGDVDIGKLSLEDNNTTANKPSRSLPQLSITAVDIAEWSNVVDRLSKNIHSTAVPGSKSCHSPLLRDESSIKIAFHQLDVLSLSETELSYLISPQNSTHSTKLISLMFTLNELFSTSMPKTTQLLLRLTDMTEPGTILLIVDSPGSYSTLSLGGTTDSPSETKQRQYPMKFLLEHTLLAVTEGKWEKILSQDSRWFRRDASKLAYSVNLEGGEGLVKLEDMRYQIHVYRRI